jgi:transposase
VSPPWEGLSKHFTKAFEAMALLLLRQMPVSATARQVGETDKRLWRMLWAHVGAAYPKADFSGVTCVGCDEMSVRKGHHYISVFCDLIDRRVLFACEGKDKQTWEKFARELEAHNGHHRAIKQVSIDMSAAYIAGVDDYIGAQAVVVFDKFHVIAKVNEAVDATRKAEQRLANKEQRERLKASRWPLLKNPENLTLKPRAHYDNLLKSSLCAVKAHQMRLALQDIYAIPEADMARRQTARMVSLG